MQEKKECNRLILKQKTKSCHRIVDEKRILNSILRIKIPFPLRCSPNELLSTQVQSHFAMALFISILKPIFQILREVLEILPASGSQDWLKKGGYVWHFAFDKMPGISNFQGLRWQARNFIN